MQEAPVPGTPSQFVKQLGHAELLASATGPSDGVADVNYSFSIEILRESGLAQNVSVTLLRDDTLGNAALGDPIGGVGGLRDDFSAALNGALTDAGFAGQVSVQLDGGKFKLVGNQPDIVRLTVHDGAALGFGASQLSPQSVTLAATSDATLVLSADQTFSLDIESVGGAVTTVQFSLNAAATTGNADGAALAAELQALFASLSSAGFADGAVGVSAAGDRLTLHVSDPNIVKITLHDEGDIFGFGAVRNRRACVAMSAMRRRRPTACCPRTWSSRCTCRPATAPSTTTR